MIVCGKTHTLGWVRKFENKRGAGMATTSFEEFARPYREAASPASETVRKAAGRAFAAELAEREAIGSALASARKECGATQQAVANAAGIQQAELSRIENGRGNPTVETLLKILAALDLRLSFEPARGNS